MRVGRSFFRRCRAALWAAGIACGISVACSAQMVVFNNGGDDEQAQSGGFTVKKVDPKITDALADFSRYSEKLAWEKAFKAIAPLADVEVNGMVPSKDGFLFPRAAGGDEDVPVDATRRA